MHDALFDPEELDILIESLISFQGPRSNCEVRMETPGNPVIQLGRGGTHTGIGTPDAATRTSTSRRSMCSSFRSVMSSATSGGTDTEDMASTVTGPGFEFIDLGWMIEATAEQFQVVDAKTVRQWRDSHIALERCHLLSRRLNNDEMPAASRKTGRPSSHRT
jgi:hypothetical protein